MVYKQLSYEERVEIERLLYQNVSIPEIARRLNRHYNTVYHEVKRINCYQRDKDGIYNTSKYHYDANIAHYYSKLSKKQSSTIESIEQSKFSEFLVAIESQFNNSEMTLLECFKYVEEHYPEMRRPKSIRTIKSYIENNVIDISMEEIKNREFKRRKEKKIKKLVNELKEDMSKIYNKGGNIEF